MEIIFEVIIIVIFRYPGAAIRWLFLRKKRTFKSILKEDAYSNAAVSFLVIGVVIATIQILKPCFKES